MLRELQNKNRGFALLEIVIASFIIAAIAFGLISVFLLSQNTAKLSREKLQAAFLAEEGLEVLRFLRDSGWTANISSLAVGTDYYLVFSTTTPSWTISVAPPQKIEGLFERSFRVEDVSRDPSFDIETPYNPANYDPETKKIVMKVSWLFKDQDQAVTMENYLTNLFGN